MATGNNPQRRKAVADIGDIGRAAAESSLDVARGAKVQAASSSIGATSGALSTTVHTAAIFLYPLTLTAKYIIGEEKKNADKLASMAEGYDNASDEEKAKIEAKFNAWIDTGSNTSLREKSSFKQNSTLVAIGLSLGIGIASVAGVTLQVAIGNFVVAGFSLVSAGKALGQAVKCCFKKPADTKGAATNIAAAGVAIGFGALMAIAGPIAGAIACAIGGGALVYDVNNDRKSAISTMNEAGAELFAKIETRKGRDMVDVLTEMQDAGLEGYSPESHLEKYVKIETDNGRNIVDVLTKIKEAGLEGYSPESLLEKTGHTIQGLAIGGVKVDQFVSMGLDKTQVENEIESMPVQVIGIENLSMADLNKEAAPSTGNSKVEEYALTNQDRLSDTKGARSSLQSNNKQKGVQEKRTSNNPTVARPGR